MARSREGLFSFHLPPSLSSSLPLSLLLSSVPVFQILQMSVFPALSFLLLASLFMSPSYILSSAHFPPFLKKLTNFPAPPPQSSCPATVQTLLSGNLRGQWRVGWVGGLGLGLSNFMFCIRGQVGSGHTSGGSAAISCHVYLLTCGSSTPQ